MKPKTKKGLIIIGVIICGLLAVPAWFGYRIGMLPRVDSANTFHAPIFSQDGREIYYIERKVWGISWGLGIEFFTLPAHVVLIRDRFLLRSLDRESGSERTLSAWTVPHPWKPREQYRNYLFGIPDCELKLDAAGLHFKIGLDFLPDDPAYLTVKEWTTGTWNRDGNNIIENDHWKKGNYMVNSWTEQVLSGPFEVVNYRNVAIVLYDAGTGQRIPLRVSNSASQEQVREIETFDPTVYTHRAQLERSRTIRETYSAITQNFQSQGLPEGPAMLRANDEMEKLGYYPKTPKLVAQKLSSPEPGVQVFEISEDEFRFGLFQDIEEAIAKAGTEVHFHGSYIKHRDYETSDKLNRYLDAGNRKFVVSTVHGRYLVTIQK